jgi:hypothetical protein
MAKQYYSAEEARQKLHTDDDGLKLLVRQGRLREFRDAGKLNYRVEEVDAIVAEKAGALGGSGELLLEPAEDSAPGATPPPAAAGSSIGSAIFNLEDTGTPEKPAAKTGSGTGSGSGVKLGDSDLGLGGSDVLSLEEVDKEAVEGMRKDDTVITNVGISVFDDEDLEIAADPMAKTIATGGAEHLGLEGSGGGSGLLDLTRESDDTSLGADVLGDIELTDDVTQTTEATATTDMGEAPAPEAPAEPAVMAPRLVQVVGAFPADPSAPVFSGLLIAGMLVMAIVGAAAAAMTLDVWPAYLDVIYRNLLISTGAMVGVGGLCALIGWLIGRQPAPRREKAAKPAKSAG